MWEGYILEEQKPVCFLHVFLNFISLVQASACTWQKWIQLSVDYRVMSNSSLSECHHAYQRLCQDMFIEELLWQNLKKKKKLVSKIVFRDYVIIDYIHFHSIWHDVLKAELGDSVSKNFGKKNKNKKKTMVDDETLRCYDTEVRRHISKRLSKLTMVEKESHWHD